MKEAADEGRGGVANVRGRWKEEGEEAKAMENRRTVSEMKLRLLTCKHLHEGKQ